MPMQISIDELLSMLLARIDSLSLEAENQKTRFDVMCRILYKKGLITEDEVLDSIKEEHRILKEIGVLDKEPSPEALSASKDSMVLWLKGDAKAIKKTMDDYEKRVKESMAAQQKGKIDVAPAAVLDQLDRMNGGQSGNGKKLIL